MKNSIIIFGTISGLVVITSTILGVQYGRGSVWLGFLVMFIALSTIYVAIKQHRDSVLGGVISFKTGLLMGIGISAMAAVVYTAVWEVYLYVTDYAFTETMANSIIEAGRLPNASDADLRASIEQAESFRQQYGNALVRIPMTFLEIFPVGIIVSLFSAWLLRNHKTA